MRRGLAVLLAAMAVVGSACAGPPSPSDTEPGGTDPGGTDPAPWWCTATAWSEGHGHHYSGQSKGDLSPSDCDAVTGSLEAARDYAVGFPTLGDAHAAGFTTMVPYVAGMGTHDALIDDIGALLADPGFDRFDPVFPGTEVDGVFDPTRPEFLQYDAGGPAAGLVGMSWFVRTEDGMPPEGFAGGNDWWHNHPNLCFHVGAGVVIGENRSEVECQNLGGANVYLHNYWMVHAWVVPGMEYRIDVFENHHPCLLPGGATWDPADACFTTPPEGGHH